MPAAASRARTKPLRSKCDLPAGPLILVLVFVAYVRLHYADIPLERDEGEYAYAGQLIALVGPRLRAPSFVLPNS